ncbi:hypothetical protein OU994_13015 [Pseudoduganella sp. SL102]|uniref:hypothetical protein n=1 Tax=Pseudoduganella sp. SL102 TaxID=2995154 RepID=UPI00248BE6C5|nr:hypothetical protein [Pseudoduganella sp. SL102]WBS05126.1 hypothetical protein OU994_13015 [Pseudoduganella sp. SL102]
MRTSLFAQQPTGRRVNDSSCRSAIEPAPGLHEHMGTMANAGTAVLPVPADPCQAPCAHPSHESHPGKRTTQEFRRNALVSRQVETGLIFMEMLGVDDARAYWRAANIPESVIERLVDGHPGRVPTLPRSAPSIAAEIPFDADISLFYCHAGRRQDLVAAAVVQAAIALAQELGRERAERMLRREGLGSDVIERVLSKEGSGRRIS